MPPISYIVCATLPDEPTRQRYVRWLRAGHVQAVLRGGADHASIVEISDPPDPIQVETHYRFPGPEAFEDYLRDHAPALRREGMDLFGSDSGVRFSRRVGRVL